MREIKLTDITREELWAKQRLSFTDIDYAVWERNKSPITAFIASLLSVTRALAFHSLDRKSDCASHFCKVHAFPVIIGACRTRPMSAICFTPATCPCPESRAALFASPMRVKAAMSKATPDSHTSHLAEQNASSGLFDLSGEEWRCALGAVNHFDDCAEVFLGQWTLRMKAAGYLSFTTARREDCMTSCDGLLDAMKGHADRNTPPSFETLRTNADGWADALKSSGLRHLRRGITSSMFLGCYKTFTLAVQDALEALPRLAPEVTERAAALAARLVEVYSQAFEIVWMETCMQAAQCAHTFDQDELFRLLTVEKCRFENVFNATSDGVLVMNSACRIVTANRSLRQYAGENLENKYVWDALGLEETDAKTFFARYKVGQTVEISPFGNGLVFRLSMASLGDLSMASSGDFLLLLNNITPHVLHREMLEDAVQRQTQDLQQEKQRLEELNITLRNVLRHVEEERCQQSDELAENVRSFLWPALAELGREQDAAARKQGIELAREQLERILGGTGSAQEQMVKDKGLGKLTLAELKICQWIQTGRTTKEIAAILRISPETVQTHRRNIRRKLGVRGHDTQLAMYLITSQA